MLHAVCDAGLGDLVEGHAVLIGEVQVEQVGQMPGDGLPFAVGVGRKIDVIAFFSLLLQLGNQLFLALDDLVFWLEIIFDVHAQAVLRRSRTCPMDATTS